MPLTLGTSDQLGSATLGAGGASALSGTAVLTNTCDILANTGASDGLGGFLDNWTVASADVICSVVVKTAATASDRKEGERQTSIGYYEFTMPDTTTIVPQNRILFNGFTFELQDAAIPIPNQATILVFARLVR